ALAAPALAFARADPERVGRVAVCPGGGDRVAEGEDGCRVVRAAPDDPPLAVAARMAEVVAEWAEEGGNG
ncbi:MAG TPA: hypothetical protein VHG91_06390, partial [Longimicrobium sp.]|nr:hypothetical protein [Longimicrobium sp.]